MGNRCHVDTLFFFWKTHNFIIYLAVNLIVKSLEINVARLRPDCFLSIPGGRRGHDRMVVGFTTTFAVSAYHHWSCEFESFRWGVIDTTLYDKVCLWLVTGQWFSPGTLVSSTNKTYRHDIAEILLIVALNIITLTPHTFCVHFVDDVFI
jgi:hypothetical protein